MRAFTDVYKDTLEVDDYRSDRLSIRAIANSFHDTDVITVFHPSDARAVAAEIIACADRIEGKDSSGPPRAELVPVVTHVSTPTHTSHASLVVFAKAIAYLPQPMRDELNALLASKLRVALS